MEDEKGLTPRVLADELGVSRSAVVNAIQRGIIAAQRDGRGFQRIRRDDVPEAWVRAAHKRRASQLLASHDGGGGEVDPPTLDVESSRGDESEVAFLRSQLRAKDAVIGRLVTLLEARRG